MLVRLVLPALMVWVCVLVSGCAPIAPGNGASSDFANTTDPTNDGASYLGSAACGACHADIADRHTLHGHANQLTAIVDGAPVFPGGVGTSVPQPPAGFSWQDIAYVIGGYVRRASFIDRDGFIPTTGSTGVNTQWNLQFLATGTPAGFVAFDASTPTSEPYTYSCFNCHATGPQPQNPGAPQFQDNRPGIVGTWHEAGIQCEACHGPGSRHPGNPQNRDMYVETGAELCGRCHSTSPGTAIHAAGGFIGYREQYAELRASGGHSAFACTYCHDPHSSVRHDPAGIRNSCVSCHPDKKMGFHEGQVYVRGDYVESLTCMSCHMPLAGRSAGFSILGESAGRVGDVRTHIFRINTQAVGYDTMFAPDGGTVRVDSENRAAATVDFVCLRCHNTYNGYPFQLSIRSAAGIAAGIHSFE